MGNYGGFSIFLGILLIGIMAFYFLPLVGSSDEGIMNVEVEVYGDIVSIQVPDHLFLGSVSKGQEVRSAGKVKINNTGNVAVKVYTSLVNSSDNLFSNLYFNYYASGNYTKVGEYNFTIDAPSTLGDVEYYDFYVKLDLTNYHNPLPSGINRVNSSVKFTAVSN